jgi:rare lipoprotein A
MGGGCRGTGGGHLPLAFLAVAALLLSACAGGSVATRTIVPGKEYEADGARYRVLEAAEGFTERGTASWYGEDFHGRATASGETYDMEELTAAHRVLPLGTRIRVRRLDIPREVTVRINDRGPFARDRIVDLSRAAARRLDMIECGTAPVELEAMEPGKDLARGDFTVQLGSFSDRENALRLAREVRSRYDLPSEVVSFDRGDAVFHRVRAGRFPSLAEGERARRDLEDGFPGAFVVAR